MFVIKGVDVYKRPVTTHSNSLLWGIILWPSYEQLSLLLVTSSPKLRFAINVLNFLVTFLLLTTNTALYLLYIFASLLAARNSIVTFLLIHHLWNNWVLACLLPQKVGCCCLDFHPSFFYHYRQVSGVSKTPEMSWHFDIWHQYFTAPVDFLQIVRINKIRTCAEVWSQMSNVMTFEEPLEHLKFTLCSSFLCSQLSYTQNFGALNWKKV